MSGKLTRSIIPTPVPHEEREGILLSLFGFMSVEGKKNVKTITKLHCTNFYGDPWGYMRLSNGGAYMMPQGREKYVLHISVNHPRFVLSSHAIGITLTLLSLNTLIYNAYFNGWIKPQKALRKQYRLLKAYARQHKEWSNIRSVTKIKEVSLKGYLY